MKKIHLRCLTWVFLLALSVYSYLHLNSLTVEEYEDFAIEETGLDIQSPDETEIMMPDIALVKKIIDLGKMVFLED